MAFDPMSELRDALTERLARLWGYNASDYTSLIVPDELRDHVDSVRATPVPADIAELVASQMSREEEVKAFNDDSTGSLPLGARLKPRGLYEDDWAARPSKDYPWPVVLVHGTSDTNGAWELLANDLRTQGWCVFAPAYGHRATDPVEQSAAQVGSYVEAVLAVTGAEQAIVVGHSQGGLVLRYWMSQLGGGDKVKHMICLAAPNHGTTLGGIVSPLMTNKMTANVVDSLVRVWFGPVGFQQVVGSEVIRKTNEHGDLVPGVTYTCIATRSDAVIQPPETCFLEGSPDVVDNIWVQSLEPGAQVMHEMLPMDIRSRKLVMIALHRVREHAGLVGLFGVADPLTEGSES